MLKTTVIKRLPGIDGHEILHIDDDLYKFTTVLRRYARLVLTMLLPFCFHYVFTSASRGYMINCVSLIEAGYAQDAEHFKSFKPPRLFKFFQPNRLSCTDFPERHLRNFGKSVKESTQSETAPAILIDDKSTYHYAQPLHGILIKLFPNE